MHTGLADLPLRRAKTRVSLSSFSLTFSLENPAHVIFVALRLLSILLYKYYNAATLLHVFGVHFQRSTQRMQRWPNRKQFMHSHFPIVIFIGLHCTCPQEHPCQTSLIVVQAYHCP